MQSPASTTLRLQARHGTECDMRAIQLAFLHHVLVGDIPECQMQCVRIASSPSHSNPSFLS